nr:reverse transcriptase domain-containing protein [Tanacetum cinerariifolium]
MDDKPMWATDRVVTPTLSSVITIPEIVNEFAIKDSNRDIWHSSRRNDYNRDNYRSNTDDKSYDLERQFNDFMKSRLSTNTFVKETFMDLKTQLETVAKIHQASIQNFETKFDKLTDKQSGRPSGSLPSNTQPNPRGKQKQLNLGVGTERMIFNIDPSIKHSYSNDDTCFSIVVIDEIVEEDFDALLDEGSKILHSIEGTILKEEIFFEFDKFIAMVSNKNYDFESDKEQPKFEKITINTNYKIKASLKGPPMDLELKPFPDNLEYVFWKNLLFFL